MKKIPVNIITGFLGAGKTTAIIRLLKQKTSDEQWAVIVNEFGKISIDSQTLKSFAEKGSIYNISGGCICCSAKAYFRENLTEIINSGNFSRIIIEPSGLGGIDMVSEAVESNPNLVLMPKICLVDIHMVDIVRIHELPIYRIQIIKSEIIVFTKCDLLLDKFREAALKSKFSELYPGKEIREYSTISTLLNVYNAIYQQKSHFRLATLASEEFEDSNFHKKIFVFDFETTFNPEKLTGIFSKYPEILRAKGHIRSKNNWLRINYTLSYSNYELCKIKEQNEIVVITEKVPDYFFEQLNMGIQNAIIK
ncbi:MAG: GTP-binding protein [Paludibacter sp.]|nr:GTP-binding protein [Paludibacter sp.]